MKTALLLEKNDNVAVVLDDVEENEVIKVKGLGDSVEIISLNKIDLAHKIAIKRIPRGHPIFKYGEVIGISMTDIEVGSHVHIHNIYSTRTGGK